MLSRPKKFEIFFTMTKVYGPCSTLANTKAAMRPHLSYSPLLEGIFVYHLFDIPSTFCIFVTNYDRPSNKAAASSMVYLCTPRSA